MGRSAKFPSVMAWSYCCCVPVGTSNMNPTGMALISFGIDLRAERRSDVSSRPEETMTARKADAEWTGNLREGAGTVRLGSGTFEGKYSFATRFEEAPGTNPEEWIAAAHAGCFSMALPAGLGTAGFKSKTVPP